jgi:hypothetical protein
MRSAHHRAAFSINGSRLLLFHLCRDGQVDGRHHSGHEHKETDRRMSVGEHVSEQVGRQSQCGLARPGAKRKDLQALCAFFKITRMDASCSA